MLPNPVLLKFHSLLEEAKRVLGDQVLEDYSLRSDNNIQPFVGGQFDVKDRWESVILPVINQHGVHVEVQIKLEISTNRNRAGSLVFVRAFLEAWYPTQPEGTFPLHSGPVTQNPFIHTTMPPMADIVAEALKMAGKITPSDVRDPSWKTITVGEATAETE